jgi:hypothetical protein
VKLQEVCNNNCLEGLGSTLCIDYLVSDSEKLYIVMLFRSYHSERSSNITRSV